MFAGVQEVTSRCDVISLLIELFAHTDINYRSTDSEDISLYKKGRKFRNDVIGTVVCNWLNGMVGSGA